MTIEQIINLAEFEISGTYSEPYLSVYFKSTSTDMSAADLKGAAPDDDENRSFAIGDFDTTDQINPKIGAQPIRTTLTS